MSSVGGTDMRALIAVDLGAESCRVSLLRWRLAEHTPEPHLQLVSRFPNGPVRAADGSIRWAFAAILAGVEEGIRQCAELAPEGIRSIARDGWAVDYVRLNADGAVLAEPFCYRDERTVAAAVSMHSRIATDRLWEMTGVQMQPLNTLYQLYADRLAGEGSAYWLNLPEACLHHLGAAPVAEQTNASHTGMVDLHQGTWSEEIFAAADLDQASAPRIVPAGTRLGPLRGKLASIAGLGRAELIAPACHDTASAIAGIAESGDDWAYISCGTWSLIGAVLPRPLTGPGVCEDQFTNLRAVGGGVCFHKSAHGMWLLKQCMEAWEQAGEPWELADLLADAEREPVPDHPLRVDDESLLGVGDMPGRIQALRRSHGLRPLAEGRAGAPAMVSLVLHGLAAQYAEAIRRLEQHTGRCFRRIVMVGGGARNGTLRRFTQQSTGLEVATGPSESSTIGNFAVQLAALKMRGAAHSGESLEFASAVSAWAARLGRADFLQG